MFHDGLAWSDFPTQWRVCVYTLRGIDIYTLRTGSNFLPDIGEIGAGFHASPWGSILESIFYGGFLPLGAAKIYFLAANIFVLILASYFLWLKAGCISRDLSSLVLIVSVLSADFMVSVHEGNAGGMICAFLLTAWLLCDDHPYISGVLIAFAMVKPQDALIVCIAILLMRKIKPLFIGAIIDISAWGVTAFLTRTGMFELLREFLFMPAEKVSRPPFAGIFTLLIDGFLPAAGMSMLAGIVFVILLHILLPKNMPEMFKIYPAFIAVTFWCYSYSNDCYVLVLPACMCFWAVLENIGTMHKLFWTLGGIYCAFGLIVRSVTARILMSAISRLSYTSAHVYARTIYELGLIVLSIIICVELRRKYMEAKS